MVLALVTVASAVTAGTVAFVMGRTATALFAFAAAGTVAYWVDWKHSTWFAQS